MNSSGTPSTISTEAVPRISSALAVAGVSPVSIVSATLGRAPSAPTFGAVGAVNTRTSSPSQWKPVGTTRGVPLGWRGHPRHPNGTPRVVPTGFHWDGEDVLVFTAPTAPKVGALGARPSVALTIDTGDTPATARALLIRGTASVEIVDGVPEEFIEASAKTLYDAQREEFEAGARQTYEQMA